MKLVIPPYVDLPRKKSKPKRVYLSYNVVKNLHYMVYNDVKGRVSDLIRDQLADGTGWQALQPPVKVICTMYNTGEREQDLDNMFPVIKFAMDAVVNLGYLPDDNIKYVKEVTYRHGGKDKANPRYEVDIEPYLP